MSPPGRQRPAAAGLGPEGGFPSAQHAAILTSTP
jgi:hypothetical protein